jgi:mevalonate kinase
LTSIAKAPGKIILFGEHFVVYDNRAILGAIDKFATVTSEKTNTDNILISSSKLFAGNKKDEDVNKDIFKGVVLSFTRIAYSVSACNSIEKTR